MFGAKIKKLINELGISQLVLSKDLGLSPAGIHKILNDKSIPSAKVIQKLGSVYNVNLYWLFYDEGEIFRNYNDSNLDKSFGSKTIIKSEASKQESVASSSNLSDNKSQQSDMNKNQMINIIENLAFTNKELVNLLISNKS